MSAAGVPLGLHQLLCARRGMHVANRDCSSNLFFQFLELSHTVCKRISRAHTSAFATSDFIMSVWLSVRLMKKIPCAFIIRLLCKSLPCAIEKSLIRIRMRKSSRIRAYGSVPYI